MVHGIEGISEIKIDHPQLLPLLCSLLKGPMQGLNLPLCRMQPAETLLGGVQQPVSLSQAVQSVCQYRR